MKVNENQLSTAKQQANLNEEDSPPSLPEIVEGIRAARANLRELHQKHVKLRESHLAALAEAWLMDRNPNHMNLHLDEQEKQRRKEVRRIQWAERVRRTHRRVRGCLKHTEDRSPLSSIDIPNRTQDTLMYNGDEVKAWKGSWKTIQNPEEIAQHICQANVAQYHQAHDTPFGSKPLLS